MHKWETVSLLGLPSASAGLYWMWLTPSKLARNWSLSCLLHTCEVHRTWLSKIISVFLLTYIHKGFLPRWCLCFLCPAKLCCHQSSVSMLTSLSYGSCMFWAFWLPKLRLYPLLWLLACLRSLVHFLGVLRWGGEVRQGAGLTQALCLPPSGGKLHCRWGFAVANFLTTVYVSVLLALEKINGFIKMYGKCILIIAGSTFSWGADGSLGFGLGKMIAARIKDRNLMGTAFLWQSRRMILLY